MNSKLAALLGAALVFGVAGPSAQSKNPKVLDIYVVDTEGGKATLFVAPSGESVLVDSGNPGGRDTDRIMLAIEDAGLKQIDYLVSTHYHVDHIGGMQELAKRIPIAHYVDHGPSVEEREQVPDFQQAYAEARAKAKHTVVKPGDRLPVAGLDWRIVTSAGKVLEQPLPGGGAANPACATFTPKENARDPENAQSLGSVIAYGRFRAIDLGDLLWNNEADLMCPDNPVGQVDLYLVTHHGLDASGSPQLVHGVQPRVAVMQNGTRKGGAVQAFQIMRSSPRLQDIWQSHWSWNAGVEHNSAGVFIANVDDPATIASVLTNPPGPRGGGPGRGGPGPGATPPAGGGTGAPGTPPAAPAPSAGPPPAPAPFAAGPGTPGVAPAQGRPGGGRGGGAAAAHAPAYWIRISAQADGSFTVTNARNGFSKTYPPTAK
ncbi:MAG TPA: MBL fold metallo-hydrolase [Vicinamibacterales bacterium]|nr:MBL fold metallo-hydrolase [Vicinamibacterales bacterium]